VIGFLIAGVLSAGSTVQNRSDNRYAFRSELFDELVEQINLSQPRGRVFFTGFVLHHVGGGHIAPLSILTNAPLMASDPIHRYWWRVDAIPESYRARGEAGVEEYLNLFNVTEVFAHEQDWIAYFLSRPNSYQPLWEGGGFHYFRRSVTHPGYIQKGQARDLSQDSTSVSLIPETPEVILKFRYIHSLTATNCEVEPEVIEPEVALIRLTKCVPGKLTRVYAEPVFISLWNYIARH
jgi:hypothetical protein